MRTLDRITIDPEIMGGRPCIRGKRITVNIIVGLIAAKQSREDVIRLYPFLEDEDITQALQYAAWRSNEEEVLVRRDLASISQWMSGRQG
jgi:uncharacterized protein (DUF433 family)